MKLSVIVACYNGAETIEEQLQALARQAYSHPWQLIVSDNGSTDDSRVIVERYRSLFSDLVVVEAHAERGVAYARNQALNVATGDAFVFCDVDDVVGDGWLAHLGAALATHDFVVSAMDDARLNESWQREIWPAYHISQPLFGFLPAAAAYGFGFTRALYNDVGRFDQSLLRMSDIDYSWRAQLAGYRLHYVAAALVHYRHRPTVTALTRTAYHDGQAQVLLYKKYKRHGMPWPGVRQALFGWFYVMRRLVSARSASARARLAIDVAVMFGHLHASIRYRMLAL